MAWLAALCGLALGRVAAPETARLARAGSLIMIMILIHSAVDYPLRTVALSALFAFACALLVPGPEKA